MFVVQNYSVLQFFYSPILLSCFIDIVTCMLSCVNPDLISIVALDRTPRLPRDSAKKGNDLT